MPSEPRLVTGNLRDLTDAPVAGAVLTFSRIGVQGQYGNVVSPLPITVVADVNGVISTELYPGPFEAVLTPDPVEHPFLPSLKFSGTLTENGSADLAFLIGQMGGPITSGVEAAVYQALEDAQAAATASDASADAAGASETAAAGSASDAADSAIAAGASATAADGSADAAVLSADAASDSEDAAAASAAAALASQEAIETNLLVYVTDTENTLTIAVAQQMVVSESVTPYPSVTLELVTP